MVAEGDFPNGHVVLEPTSTGRLPRDKTVYMAVKDVSGGDQDTSTSRFVLVTLNQHGLGSSEFLDCRYALRRCKPERK